MFIYLVIRWKELILWGGLNSSEDLIKWETLFVTHWDSHAWVRGYIIGF